MPALVIGLAVVNAAALAVASCSCGSDGQVQDPAGVGGAGGAGGAGGGGAAGGAGGAAGGGGSASSGFMWDGGELPDALPDFTEAELEPTTAVDGIPAPLPGVYTDLGPAALGAGFRALMGFPIRDLALLEQGIEEIYDPLSPDFRDYFTKDEWMAAFAPLPIDVHLAKLWIEAHGMQVDFTASNRLLLQLSGTVQQFNEAFEAELRLFERENPQTGNPPIQVYGTLGPLTVPAWLADRMAGVITCDLPASTNQLPGEAGTIVNMPPSNVEQGRSPAQMAHAYDVDDLYALGYDGAGQALGVIAAATFKFKDLQSFWQSFGITREDPIVVETMEPVATRYLETTIDTEWSGAMAPGAQLVVYEGPDSRNTSMVYNFNEAIGRAEVAVLTDSFAHREDAEPKAVRDQYGRSATMAAALGITVVAASGDSAEPDTPSSSPYVTAVGGTRVFLDVAGEVVDEIAWSGSGSGITKSFPLPYWQQGIVADSNGKRAVVDVALNASPSSPLWTYWLASWSQYGGTSYASPMFAGMIAVINQHREAQGLPRVGWLNATLYQTPEVRATFRDIVSGATMYHSAEPGWDYPTGWGAPSAIGLANTLP